MTSTLDPSALADQPDTQESVFVFPASFAQQRLWFLDRLVPHSPFYNVTAALRLTGTLNISALEQSLNEIVRRHETLRTSFARVDGALMQVVTPHLPLTITAIDWQKTAAPIQTIQQRALTELQTPFDLAQAPLLRVTLLQLNPEESILLLSLHHIVADGWSIGLLLGELSTLYRSFLAGQPSPLPDLPIQYADFSHWQHQSLQGERLAAQLTYWQQQLSELSPLNLPTDYPRPPVPTYAGARQYLELSAELTAALEALSQAEGVTLFMTLLAAFQTLLHRYIGQTDIAVGSPIANRNLSQVEGLIGFFVNSLVLRTDFSGDPSFRDLLRQVQATTLAAYAHQDLPFEKLVEVLQPTRDLSRNPLFQVVFALQNTPIAPLDLPGLQVENLDFPAGTTRVDLEFHCFKSLDRLHCSVIYSSDLFAAATIEGMLHHFQTLLRGIVTNPAQSVSCIPLLTASEQQQLLSRSHETIIGSRQGQQSFQKENLRETFRENPNFLQAFEPWVTATPNAVAVVDGDRSLTYQELNQRANRLSHHLQQRGVQPETLVGLWLDRSPALIISILAIWKAGGAYLPLDPSLPRDRLTWMVADAQVSLLLTASAYLSDISALSDAIPIVNLDAVLADSSQPSVAPSVVPLSGAITPEQLAYVIYTSGSTGQPKGVLVEHRGLSNVILAQRQVWSLRPRDRILQFASPSFDASIFEIVMALANGATLYLADPDSRLPGPRLLKFLRRHAITHATLPPAVLALLPAEDLPALQTVISAGEACSPRVVEQWAPGRQFFNAYGLTETSIWATVAQLRSGDELTIGAPIANTQLYLLDQHQQPVPDGVVGEIYLGGVGIARGYLNRPDLTAARFISPSFLPRSSERLPDRLYKTGDLARYHPDGRLEFWGRCDRQVKWRGYRIELGEIEAVLSQHPSIRTAVVTLPSRQTQGQTQEHSLAAYAVLQPSATATSQELQQWLRSRLPASLIPNQIVVLHHLPLTATGKIDYAAFPVPTALAPGEPESQPRTPIEHTLAQIWAQLLHLEQVGIHDNFFHLGGDSLLAARLIEQIEQQLQRDLPLSTLFLAPTIAQLAQTLSPTATAPGWSPLVPLQPQGTKPPIFCIHPILGVVLPYCQLAQALGNDQPFYALQSLGLDGKHRPLTRIEDMAAHYIQAIQSVQPQGPYLLAGWSFGGWVAFEMAQQLRRLGQRVALVALLDTLAPVAENRPSIWGSLNFLRRTGRSLLPFLGDYLALLGELLWKTFRRRSPASRRLSPESRLRLWRELSVWPMLRIFWANSQAVLRYKPQIYPGTLSLYKTTLSAPVRSSSTLGWEQLTSAEVNLQLIPGNHFTLLRHPQVKHLATFLRAAINRALKL